MKANEAPEKIYLHPGLDSIFGMTERSCESEIEYIRTDAFIDKALAYLNDKFCFNNAFYGIVSTDFSSMEEMYEDFEEYMKGE